MTNAMSIVVATSNRSRVASIKALLGDLPVEVLSMAEALGDAAPNLVDSGATLEENARLKARAISDIAKMVCIAGDDGLEVQALGGRPGVRSARFAHEGATDAENNAELLRRLEEVEDGARTARFRAVFALIDPWDAGNDCLVEGTCEGRIARSPSGTGGYGYESLFVLEGDERTLADLDGDERDAKGHVGRALAALGPELVAVVRRRLADAEAILHGSYAPPPSRASKALA